MFDLRRIPIVRVLVPFAGGSLVGYGCLQPGQLLALVGSTVGLCFGLLVLYYRCGRIPGRRDGLFALMAFLVFVLSGLLTGILTRPADPELPLNEKVMISGVVKSPPKSGAKSWSLPMEVDRICTTDSAYGISAHLKVYVAYSKDSSDRQKFISQGVGETWRFYGQLVPINKPKNPGEIDFKTLLNRKNCWYRFFADLSCDPHRQGSPPGSGGTGVHLISSSRIRKALSVHWSGDADEISLLKAVCLGDKTELTEDLMKAYADAGAMHLLAVSGLHMGLIWWVLYHLFSWMSRLSGKEAFRALTITAILWIFAFVTGFSSSVSRSATMFSLFTLGRLMGQRSHAINGILVSAFLLILVEPARMLEVGFQLSYAAILGIVCFHPSLRRIFPLKNRLLKRIWEGIMVSVAAQVSTTPLVIYYFHQVPVYSLITNLIAIPVLSLLITFFVLSVPFMLSGIGFNLFNGLLIKLASILNWSVEGVASIPGGVVDELSLDLVHLCLWMAILFTLMLVLNQQTNWIRYLLIGLISASLCWTARCKYLRAYSSEMVIGHFSQASFITFREGNRVDHYCLLGDSLAIPYLKQYAFANWNRHNFQTRMIGLGNTEALCGAISACTSVAPGIWVLGNDRVKGWVISGRKDLYKRLLGLPAAGQINAIKADFILLSGNPPLGQIPDQLLKSSLELILDGSNQPWYSLVCERIKEDDICGFKLYNTYEQGAYLRRW